MADQGDDAFYVAMQAQAMRLGGRPRDAEQVCREAIARFPDNVLLHHELASSLWDSEDFAQAADASAAAASLAPDDPIYPAIRAQALCLDGRPGDAEEVCREAITRFPDQALLHHELGRALWDRKDFVHAADALAAAAALAPDDPDYPAKQARALRLDGRPRDAERVARESIARFPTDALLHQEVGRALWDSEEFAEAADAFAAGATLAPDDPSYVVMQAQTLDLAGRHDDAERVAREAIARFPEDAVLRQQLASSLWDREQYAEAAGAFAAAAALAPDDPTHPLRQIQAVRLDGRPRDAERIALEAIERFPDDVFLLHDSGTPCGRLGEHARAADAFARAAALAPDDPIYPAMQVQALRLDGRKDEAVLALDSLPPEMARTNPVAFQRAGVAFDDGHFDLAAQLLLTLDARDPDADGLLILALRRAGDYAASDEVARLAKSRVVNKSRALLSTCWSRCACTALRTNGARRSTRKR